MWINGYQTAGKLHVSNGKTSLIGFFTLLRQTRKDNTAALHEKSQGIYILASMITTEASLFQNRCQSLITLRIIDTLDFPLIFR